MPNTFAPLVLLAALAVAQPAPADESPAVDAAHSAAAAAEATAAADAAAAKPAAADGAQAARADAAPAEFVPPPGWKAKKRGKYTVYCQRSAEVGTRFKTETCYDETGIREMLARQQDDREKVDQMRRICGSQATCGSR